MVEVPPAAKWKHKSLSTSNMRQHKDRDATSKGLLLSLLSFGKKKKSSRENKETMKILSATKGSDSYTYPEYLARPQVLSI